MIILKLKKAELYKTISYRTKYKFSHFFFSYWLLCECFFYIKALVNFEKLKRLHCTLVSSSYHFIVGGYLSTYKNRENLKILIEKFQQKLIVSNFILTFLDHLKHKIFFVSQPWWTWVPPLSKIFGSAPAY